MAYVFVAFGLLIHLGPAALPDRLAAISAMRASIASRTARTRLVRWTSAQ